MDEDEAVGYGRPPKSSQFRKGKSGNPRGRPKGTRNLMTDLAEELGAKITITEQGRRRRVSKQQALIKAIVNKGITKGDTKAAVVIIKMLGQLEANQATQEKPEVSAEDLAMVEAYLQQFRGSDDGEAT